MAICQRQEQASDYVIRLWVGAARSVAIRKKHM